MHMKPSRAHKYTFACGHYPAYRRLLSTFNIVNEYSFIKSDDDETRVEAPPTGQYRGHGYQTRIREQRAVLCVSGDEND